MASKAAIAIQAERQAAEQAAWQRAVTEKLDALTEVVAALVAGKVVAGKAKTQ